VSQFIKIFLATPNI